MIWVFLMICIRWSWPAAVEMDQMVDQEQNCQGVMIKNLSRILCIPGRTCSSSRAVRRAPERSLAQHARCNAFGPLGMNSAGLLMVLLQASSCSSSRRTHSAWPLQAARCSGVTPFLPCTRRASTVRGIQEAHPTNDCAFLNESTQGGSAETKRSCCDAGAP